MTLSPEFRALVAMRRTWEPGKHVPEPPDEGEITRCIQTMMRRQCIYADERQTRRVYDILCWRDYAKAFEAHFTAMGYDLVQDSRAGMVALRVRLNPENRKRNGWSQGVRLKRDESMLLICLRLIFEEGYRGNLIGEGGQIECDTDGILDRLRAIANIQPDARRLEEILQMFAGKGVVRLGARDTEEKVRFLDIMPGIEVACPGTYVAEVLEEAGIRASAAGWTSPQEAEEAAASAEGAGRTAAADREEDA